MNRRVSLLLLSLLLVLSVLAGCGGKQTQAPTPAPAKEQTPAVTKTGTQYPLTVTDAAGRQVTIKEEPKRILSAAPSNTELLFALGKGDKLVGRTDFCDFPAEAAKVPSIGSFFPPSYEKIVATKADLVIMAGGNEAEREKLVKEYGMTVLVVDPQNFEQLYAGIKSLGQVLNTQEAAGKLVADMQKQVKEVTDKVAKATAKPKVYYEVWDEPLMTAGEGTFINDLIKLAGGENIGAPVKGWAAFSAEQVAAANPDIIVASSADIEGKIKARKGWESFKAVKGSKVVLVGNADHVSRPGPRLVQGLQWFAKTLHPDLMK